jgi:peptide/nickel transport system substrate-binding protein
MDSPAPNQFRIFLGEACGFVLEALGKPSSNVPFIMPKRVADTDAFKQIEDYTGSGPYIFKRDEYKPGDKAAYLKNPKYQPRKEPPSGTAGGKRVYVDRIEWNLALRDAQSQVNAIAKGEVDILEQPAFESYAALKVDQNVSIVNDNPLGFQYMLRFNHLHPPFNSARCATRPTSRSGSSRRSSRRRSGSRSTTTPAPRCSPAARPTASPRAARSRPSRT